MLMLLETQMRLAFNFCEIKFTYLLTYLLTYKLVLLFSLKPVNHSSTTSCRCYHRSLSAIIFVVKYWVIIW